MSKSDNEIRVDKNVEDYDQKRREALSKIDNAKFGWFHVRACLVAGIGFFTDAYDLFAINLASTMLGYVYWNKDSPPKEIDFGIKVSAAVGTLVGQLLFGWLADKLGRKRVIIASCGTALAGNGYAISVQAVIIIWRSILGVGIGGDYPLSAGSMMGAVFAMQGFGILAAALVSTVILSAFKSSIEADPLNVDYCWRILLGVGAVPGLLALYFRLTIPETPRYTMDIERNVEQATRDISNVLTTGTYEDRDPDAPVVRVEAPRHGWQDFKSYFGKWKNGKVLLGTSVTWFALDVAFYGIGLNNTIILNAIGYAKDKRVFQNLWNNSIGNIIITILGTVPGYWFTVLFVDSWGRKPIQLMGFGLLTIIFIIWGFAYDEIKKGPNAGFIVIFTLAQFFQNFGPNSTTFIVPGEVFPTRYRSTGHGISAASGKLGAIIAQIIIYVMKSKDKGDSAYIPTLIKIFALFMFIGLLFTFLIPETKGLTLEELSMEEQVGFVKSKEEKKEDN
ncbi:2887_t:CDS:2 [Ambispora gerdemannii]|uniref:2887_t:CDS:1 n=1 Tax=Ambispora gerdemannii TaxID=144530 RepID=A0A9N9BA64_9GLOM|nr:2887_t:CDS:2 [Ambispora gerdemannii]